MSATTAPSPDVRPVARVTLALASDGAESVWEYVTETYCRSRLNGMPAGSSFSYWVCRLFQHPSRFMRVTAAEPCLHSLAVPQPLLANLPTLNFETRSMKPTIAVLSARASSRAIL